MLVIDADTSSLSEDERTLASTLRSPGRRATFVAGRMAARLALTEIGCESRVQVLGAPGTAPVVVGAPSGVVVSITHAAGRAVAVAASGSGVGVDLCPWSRSDRLAAMAPRFLRAERPLLGSERELVKVWSMKEAGLKALGVGSIDGGFLDGSADVNVLSVAPPVLDPRCLEAQLSLTQIGALAIVRLP